MQLMMEIVEVRDKVENKTPTTLEISHRKRGLIEITLKKHLFSLPLHMPVPWPWKQFVGKQNKLNIVIIKD